MQISYFENASVPGKLYFGCPAGFGTLSQEACGQRHTLGKCQTCKSCSIGQAHAGNEPPRLDLSKRCCRCLDLSFRFTFGLCDRCYVKNRPALALFAGEGNRRMVFKAASLPDVLVRLVQVGVHPRQFCEADSVIESPAILPRKRRKPVAARHKPIPTNPTPDMWQEYAGTAL